jgi:hypothetical protein
MADLPRTGIQGLHTLPQQIWDDFELVFEKFLPGWNINGIYNLQAWRKRGRYPFQRCFIVLSPSHATRSANSFC